jgi:hypothetical protein
MDIKLGLVVAAMLGALGCATSTTGRGGPGFAGVGSDAMPSVRVGELRVIDPHVNPMVPVHVTSPLGAPVEISPPDADVFGAPQAVTTDGHHVVATFAASSEGTFRLVAVPIDDIAAVDASQMTARK